MTRRFLLLARVLACVLVLALTPLFLAPHGLAPLCLAHEPGKSAGSPLPADQQAPGALELHVATSGSDKNPGTAEKPVATLHGALARLGKQRRILVHAGVYRLPRTLGLKIDQLEIAAAPGEMVVLEQGDFAGALIDVVSPGVTLQGMTLDGRFVRGSHALKGAIKAHRLAIKNCEVKNFTRHALDIDGTDCRVEDCHIHHILWWEAGRREDAHGIVTLYAQSLSIVGCNIHHVSGDCFQADRGAWNKITIEGCRLWDGPLESEMAGYAALSRAAENAIDTKLSAEKPRGRLVIRRSRVYGFRSSFIDNAAAFNLKENVDAVVDGCDIDDSEIAFRLRGRAKNAQLDQTIVNSTIRNCDVAVRYEDGLEDFRFVHNATHECRRLFVKVQDSVAGKNWVVANNLFFDAAQLPREAGQEQNRALPITGNFDRQTLAPRSIEGLAGKPVASALPEWYAPRLERDFAGQSRSADSPTLGAYEMPPSEPPSEKD
jgi:hypothetical protein